MSGATAAAAGAGSSGAAGGGTSGTAGSAGAVTSFTECRAIGIVERQDYVGSLANLLRSLCSSYCTHATHTVVLRMPLPSQPGAPPGGTSALLRLIRRLPGGGLSNPQSGSSRSQNPFLEEPQERWEIRHEGPPLQGPTLNALPASMKEVLDTCCFGSGTLAFWKALGGKLEYEMYRDGNEYSIVFHGHEIKVVLASVCSLVETHVLKDASSLKRVGNSLVVEASLLVPEGRHYEGANLLGVFGGQLLPYVKLVRAEVPPAVAAGRRK